MAQAQSTAAAGQGGFTAHQAAARLAWTQQLATHYVGYAATLAAADADYANHMATAAAQADHDQAAADFAYTAATAPLGKQHLVQTTNAQADYDQAVVGRDNTWYNDLGLADKTSAVATAGAQRNHDVALASAEAGYQHQMAQIESTAQVFYGLDFDTRPMYVMKRTMTGGAW